MSGEMLKEDAVVLLQDCGELEEAANSRFKQLKPTSYQPNKMNNKILIAALTACLVFLVTVLMVVWVSSMTKRPSLKHAQTQTEMVWSREELMNGVFKLTKLAPNYKDYMSSLGIPEPIIPLMLNSSEVVEIYTPLGDDDTWKIHFETDFGQHAIEFQLGQEFLVSHHEDRTHHRHLCHSPSVSILSCTIVSEARGWNSTSKMTFSPAGFVEDIKNVKSNLSTFKIFARITEEGVSVRPPSNLPDLSDDYDDIEDILEDFD